MTLPIYVIITAGGQGARMGSAVPKQFLDLCGKPVLYHSIKAFADTLPEAHIILVLPPAQISYAQMVLQHFTDRIAITLVAGGETRFHSVQNGLKGLPTESIIMVHDGVRPLVSSALIHSCYKAAMAKGSAIPCVAVSDSIREVDTDRSVIVDRTKLRAVQTPQAFHGEVLVPSFAQAYTSAFTDEASVAEAAGHVVWIVEGERRNIKITTPEDMVIATALMMDQEGTLPA